MSRRASRVRILAVTLASTLTMTVLGVAASPAHATGVISISPISDPHTHLLEPVSVQIQATAPLGDRITNYTVTGLPAGLTANAGTGLITGTPSYLGRSTVTIIVIDSYRNISATTIDWTIEPNCAQAGQQLIKNPGFETGDHGFDIVPPPWISPTRTNGDVEVEQYAELLSWLGPFSVSMYQVVTVPSACHASLSFSGRLQFPFNGYPSSTFVVSAGLHDGLTQTMANANAIDDFSFHRYTFAVNWLSGTTAPIQFSIHGTDGGFVADFDDVTLTLY
jgi:hypothetical protein